MSDNVSVAAELQRIRSAYVERGQRDADSPIDLYGIYSRQEFERIFAQMLRPMLGGKRPADLSCVDVGCGSGGNLLRLLTLGFRPENLIGVELMAARAADARHRLPSNLEIRIGDASAAQVADCSQDLALVCTVFSSILSSELQIRLARQMWRWLKPGGAVILYDFVYNNPANPDVRGVKPSRVSELFPDATIELHRVTVAPPIGRRVCKFAPIAWPLVSALPMIRTHMLCRITKSAAADPRRDNVYQTSTER